MYDDLIFEARSDYAENDPLPPKETLLIIREVGDFELRFFFNPSRFNIKKVDIITLITRLSLRAGISKPDLDRLQYGEIVIRLNPIITDKRDVEYIKNLFLEYFDNLAPIIF